MAIGSILSKATHFFSRRPEGNAQLKAADPFFWPRMLGSWFIGTSRSAYPYAADVNDGMDSSSVMAVVQWIMRAFPEAPLVVQAQQGDALMMVPDHPLATLVRQPNAYYSGSHLWMATVADWCWYGESYWRLLLAQNGQPAEIWWLPPWSIQPQWPADGSTYISHYTYQPDRGTTIQLPIEEVVHFRHGIDPRNPRHGLPPLRSVISEVWSDDESTLLVASLLRNMAVPGLVISPKGDISVSTDDVELVRAYIKQTFTGDRRGEPMALQAPIDVQKVSWSPRELDLSVVRNVTEERVAAALGIPAAVVGFGTGLEQTKVGATMAEMRRLAWQNGIVPVQRIMASELERVLLPWFETDLTRFRVSWDYDEVEALQESRDDLAKRFQILVSTGILKVSEAREALGYESTPEDEIYLRPSSLKPIDPKDQMPEPEPLPAAVVPMNGNGNGNGNAVQERSLKQGSLDEWLTAYIGRTAQRLEHLPQSILRVAARVSREEMRVRKRFEPAIRNVFDRYADATSTAALEILKPQKASAENVVRAAIIGERLPIAQVSMELGAVYEELYRAIVDAFVKALTENGYPELTSPERVQSHLQMVAQDRVGLLDLPHEARTAILDTLEQATLAGLSEDAMVAAIKEAVPRGRWLSVETRTQILVRTESRYALNVASSQYARAQGLQMLVLDAQLGPTDAVCEARRGWIVTPAQAAQLAASEHPSGTYMAIPLSSVVAPTGTTVS